MNEPIDNIEVCIIKEIFENRKEESHYGILESSNVGPRVGLTPLGTPFLIGLENQLGTYLNQLKRDLSMYLNKAHIKVTTLDKAKDSPEPLHLGCLLGDETYFGDDNTIPAQFYKIRELI